MVHAYDRTGTIVLVLQGCIIYTLVVLAAGTSVDICFFKYNSTLGILIYIKPRVELYIL